MGKSYIEHFICTIFPGERNVAPRHTKSGAAHAYFRKRDSNVNASLVAGGLRESFISAGERLIRHSKWVWMSHILPRQHTLGETFKTGIDTFLYHQNYCSHLIWRWLNNNSTPPSINCTSLYSSSWRNCESLSQPGLPYYLQ